MSDLHSKLLAAMLTSDGEIRPLLEKIEAIVKAELDAKDAEISGAQETAAEQQQNAQYWQERTEKAEADLRNMTGSRNGANAMMGVHKRRADNLRTQLDHAKAALAGDNEGVRLWMLDCDARAERFRERADIWQTAAERAEASLEILHTELAGELPLMDLTASVQRDPADREAAVARVARIRAALADPDDQTKDTP